MRACVHLGRGICYRCAIRALALLSLHAVEAGVALARSLFQKGKVRVALVSAAARHGHGARASAQAPTTSAVARRSSPHCTSAAPHVLRRAHHSHRAWRTTVAHNSRPTAAGHVAFPQVEFLKVHTSTCPTAAGTQRAEMYGSDGAVGAAPADARRSSRPRSRADVRRAATSGRSGAL